MSPQQTQQSFEFSIFPPLLPFLYGYPSFSILSLLSFPEVLVLLKERETSFRRTVGAKIAAPLLNLKFPFILDILFLFLPSHCSHVVLSLEAHMLGGKMQQREGKQNF